MSDKTNKNKNSKQESIDFSTHEETEKTETLAETDDEVTQLLADISDDETQLLVDADDEITTHFDSDQNEKDEKTEMLSDFDQTMKENLPDKDDDATEILIGDNTSENDSNDDGSQIANSDHDKVSQTGSIDSNQRDVIDDEPTEALLDEFSTQTKKHKKRYLILGAVAGVCVLAALAFFIPSQMKASEINKSLELGEKYLEEGKYQEAIIAFDDVIAIEPKQVSAYEGKGSANIGLKNYAEAEAQLETAKSIDYTDNGKALMSDVYINTERKDLAKSLLDELINHTPEETRVVVYVSKLYSQLNEYNKVIDLLEKKIATVTDKEELKKLYDELINTYVKAGKTEAEILALLERAAKATDDHSYLDKKASYSVKKPSFSLAPGEYQGTQSLEILKGSSTDKVFYTIDGSEPGVTSTEYTAPVSLQPGTITVKIIEVNENGVKCPIQEGNYSIKQNKLTNEEFRNKLKGIWYSTKSDSSNLGYLLFFSNSGITKGYFNTNDNETDPGEGFSSGKYEIIDTTENGGTIYIEKYKFEVYDVGSIKIEFDFGTPGDNKISYRFKDPVSNSQYKSNENTEWVEFTAAEYLGNNKYRIPENDIRTFDTEK